MKQDSYSYNVYCYNVYNVNCSYSYNVYCSHSYNQTFKLRFHCIVDNQIDKLSDNISGSSPKMIRVTYLSPHDII